MGGELVELTDGTKLEIKLSFATIYYLQKSKLDKMLDGRDTKELTDDEAMEASAKLIYALLRSCGKSVSFDEAMRLVPPDTEKIELMLTDFTNKLEKYKKKEEAKHNARAFQSK